MLPIGTYTLHEETAPDGYLVAEDVTFEVKDTGEIQKVVMKDEAVPAEEPETPQNKTSADAPKTGDSQNVLFWFILLSIGLTGTGAVALVKKLKK